MALNRDKLLAAKLELPTEKVDVPELGGVVIVQGMTGKQQTGFYKLVTVKGKVDEESFNARLVTHSLVDDKGERLLKDDEFVVVQEWPGAVFNRIAQAAMRVNGLGGAGN
jgi:hypothetical protein